MADSTRRITQAGFQNSPSDWLIEARFPIGRFERFLENHFRLFVNELLIDIKVSKIYGKIQ